MDLVPFHYICVLVAIFLGGVIFYFALSKKGKRSRSKDSIVFVGSCGSGKTLLAHRLCMGECPETITSMKLANMLYSATPKPLPIVDFPGHPKLRSQLPDVLGRAKKIVFVIDASNVQTKIRDAAEFLYDIFTNPLMDNGPPILIACNKSDVPGVRPPARVKLALQQELEKIRKTRQSLEVTGDTETIPLGREGKEFSIERDSPVEVTFAATSAKSGSIDALCDFISV